MSNKYEREIEEILNKSNIIQFQQPSIKIKVQNILTNIFKVTNQDLSKLILIVLAIAISRMFIPFWAIIIFIILAFSFVFVKKIFLQNLSYNNKEKKWRGQVIEEGKTSWWKKYFNS